MEEISIKGRTLVKFIKYQSEFYDEFLENVKFLVQNGVDVDASDNDGKTALYYTVHFIQYEHFLYLLIKVSSVYEEILIEAFKYSKLTITKVLFKKHFKFDHRFSDDRTPMEVALEHNFIDIFLLQNSEFFEFLIAEEMPIYEISGVKQF